MVFLLPWVLSKGTPSAPQRFKTLSCASCASCGYPSFSPKSDIRNRLTFWHFDFLTYKFKALIFRLNNEYNLSSSRRSPQEPARKMVSMSGSKRSAARIEPTQWPAGLVPVIGTPLSFRLHRCADLLSILTEALGVVRVCALPARCGYDLFRFS